MPEEYFLYFEDVAWSLQFQACGWKTALDPLARISHRESASTGRDSPLKLYYYVRNNLFFLDDWCPRESQLPVRIRLSMKLTKLFIKKLLRGKLQHTRAMILGYRDYRRRARGRTATPL